MGRQQLGQHFLTRGRILQRIAHAACPSREALVIEIGPGKGALTNYLLPLAERLVAIELDGKLLPRLREQHPALEIVHADATRVDLGQWGRAVVVGNLPYYAATPIMEAVWRLPDWIRGVFLIQREVAERLSAKPGSRDYGYLTVSAAAFCHVELLFGVPPSAFQPPPKVDSAVVRLTPFQRTIESGILDREGFLRFASACFRQKRKTLRNNLAPLYGREAVDECRQGSLRAEQLSFAELAALYLQLEKRSRAV